MALVSLFFQTKAVIGRPSDAAAGGMELDASIQEGHQAAATISKNPIEDGAQISDNIILEPLKLTMEGFVSKTPLGLSGLIGSAGTAVAGALGAANGGATSLTGGLLTTGVASVAGLVASGLGSFGANSREPKDVYEFLLELRNRRIPFDVVTALRLYQNMVLTNIDAPRNIQNVGGLRFTATLEQVTIVKAETVDLSTLSSLGGAAGPTSKIGAQAASAASGATGNNASILFNLFGGG